MTVDVNVYRKAIEVLDRHGWGRRHLLDDDGRVCILGALGTAFTGMAMNGYALPSRVTQPVYWTLTEQYPDLVAKIREANESRVPLYPYQVVMIWNDQVTEDEVRLVLEKCAVKTDEHS